MERLNFGRHDDYGEHEVHEVEEGQLDGPEEIEDDFDGHFDGHFDEEFDEVDDVGHGSTTEGYARLDELVQEQLEHTADRSAQFDADERFGYRAKARRSRRGPYVTVNLTTYRWPTFTPVDDLPVE